MASPARDPLDGENLDCLHHQGQKLLPTSSFMKAQSISAAWTPIWTGVTRRLPVSMIAITLLGVRGAAADHIPLPSFSEPTRIDHQFWPFDAGKILMGSDPSAERQTRFLTRFLQGTQSIVWNEESIECAILRHEHMIDGELVGWSQQYVAQSDDGTVYTFGEVADDEDNDGEAGDDEDDGWVVGGELPGTTRKLNSVPRPLVLMPAEPKVGSTWRVEIPPLGSELSTVIRSGETLVTPAGTFHDCIQVLETPLGSEERELSWYAPGVGWLQSLSRVDWERVDRIGRQLGWVDVGLVNSKAEGLASLELRIRGDQAFSDLQVLAPNGNPLASLFSHALGSAMSKPSRGPDLQGRDHRVPKFREPSLRGHRRLDLLTTQVPFAELDRALPEGRYQFVAKSAASGEWLYADSELSHSFPDDAQLLYPADRSTQVSTRGFYLAWTPVEEARGFRLALTTPDHTDQFEIDLPGSYSSFELSDWLRPGSDYLIEFRTYDALGNATRSTSRFQTSDSSAR